MIKENRTKGERDGESERMNASSISSNISTRYGYIQREYIFTFCLSSLTIILHALLLLQFKIMAHDTTQSNENYRGRGRCGVMTMLCDFML